jgi:hypothetical protein
MIENERKDDKKMTPEQEKAERLVSGADERVQLAIKLMQKMRRQRLGNVREQPKIAYQRFD